MFDVDISKGYVDMPIPEGIDLVSEIERMKREKNACRSRSLLPIGRFTGYSRLCGRFFGIGSMGCENRCFHIGALRCSFYGRDRQNYLSRQESTDNPT